MADTVRIGLIGCGGNMGGHVNRLLPKPEVAIAGMADPSDQSIERLRTRFPVLNDVPTFANHNDMLGEIRPDAVVISTPHSLHYEQIMTALAAGCHVLVEKPMVLRASEARDVIRAADETGKVVLVSYQRHLQPVFRHMRDVIRAGTIGEIRFIQALQNQNWYRNQKAANRWRIHPELSGGGQLNDSGSHLLDILLHVSGLTPETVYCVQENFDLTVDVNSALTINFTNGAIGSWAVVGDGPCIGGSVWEDITFYGSEGALFYRMMGGILDQAPKLELRVHVGDQALPLGELPPPSDPDTNFLDAVLGRGVVAAPPSCGLRVAELTEAAWLSAQRRLPVQISEVE